MTDTLPIHLSPPQLIVLRQLAALPDTWFVSSVKGERKVLDELTTLRLVRTRNQTSGVQYRVTVLGLAELEARDTP